MPRPALDSSPGRLKGPTPFGLLLMALALLLLVGLCLLALGPALDPPPKLPKLPGLYHILPPVPLAWPQSQSL